MYEDADAKCPYFKRANNMMIRCSSVIKNSDMILSFNRKGQVAKHRYDFCDCMSYQACPIAQMIADEKT